MRRGHLKCEGVHGMFLNIDTINPLKIAAIQENGTKMSYGELVSFCEEISACVAARSLVFSLCTNTIGSVSGYVSFLSGGIVPLLLNAELDKELLEDLVRTYEPGYMWLPEEMRDEFADTVILRKYGYVLLKRETAQAKLYPELALLLTTSGSTGSPKLVRLSYRNIEENAKSIAEYLELTDTERPITMLPMHYTYGLSVINSHLLVGATILMTETSYAQRNFWDFFKREQASSIAGVPYTYELLKKLRFFRMKLPSLRSMTQAGGKLLPEIHREFATYAKDNDKRFYVMYGQTEATARMSYLPYDRSLEKYGSMGIAIPGGRFYLLDAEGKRIDTPHVTGELVYEGANVTLGYAECLADLQKGDERNGVLMTGDMAQFDEDGYFYIVGRKKRFLKLYGNRVNLDECERMLQQHFEGMECACVGSDDSMKIYITKEENKEAVRGFLAEKTGLNKMAFEAEYTMEIPKNDAGKKLYSMLG